MRNKMAIIRVRRGEGRGGEGRGEVISQVVPDDL